jgi:hypothetical protein
VRLRGRLASVLIMVTLVASVTMMTGCDEGETDDSVSSVETSETATGLDGEKGLADDGEPVEDPGGRSDSGTDEQTSEDPSSASSGELDDGELEELEAELEAMESELGALQLPDNDFSDIEALLD